MIAIGFQRSLVPLDDLLCFALTCVQFSKNDGVAAESDRVVGLTGLEPVTLRLSSACSNQLSYKPTVGRREGPWGPTCVGGAEEARTPDL